MKHSPKCFSVLFKRILYSFSITLLQAEQNNQGALTVLRGSKNIHDMGKILTLNGQPNLDIYYDDTCNVINGTDFSCFAPFMDKYDIEWGFELWGK